MKLLAVFFRMTNSTKKRFILIKFTVTNRFEIRVKILINNTACANIQMTNFRIAHLTFWQTYCFTASC